MPDGGSKLGQMIDRGRPGRVLRRAWAMLCLALRRFDRIDGAQSAAAFAYYTFFSLFPLIILLATVALLFMDQDRARTAVIAYVENYVPTGGEKQTVIFDTIAGVVKARGHGGVVAFLILVWAAMQFLSTLISATNRAWGAEAYAWWRLPLNSLVLLVIMVVAVFLGMAMPVLMKMAKSWFYPAFDYGSWIFVQVSLMIPLLMVFMGLCFLYRLAPHRPMKLSEVWSGALWTTVLLYAADMLFVVYLQGFATLTASYGAFGGIMALLMWIFICGCILIFGACLCAAQSEMRSRFAEAVVAG